MPRKKPLEDAQEPQEDSARVRPFWSGTITFGLVSVPVALFAASRRERVALRMLDGKGNPLRREFYCPADDRVLGPDEIVRGFEVEKGKDVVVTDEELEGLEPEKSQDIDLRRFVPRDSIPPLFFERGYFLAPSGRSPKAYRLLAEAMERSGRAGIATFVMRDKEYLVAILAENGILRAETMRFEDEVRSADEVPLPRKVEVKPATVKRLAGEIRKLAASKLATKGLASDYAEKLHALVERKRALGKDVVEVSEAVEQEEAAPVDMLAFIKARMRSGEPGRARPKGRKSARS